MEKTKRRNRTKHCAKKQSLRLKKRQQKSIKMKGGVWRFTKNILNLLNQTGGSWLSGGRKSSKKKKQKGGWSKITPTLI